MYNQRPPEVWCCHCGEPVEEGHSPAPACGKTSSPRLLLSYGPRRHDKPSPPSLSSFESLRDRCSLHRQTLGASHRSRAAPATAGFPAALVDWVPYAGNPVFAGTGRDTWDRQIRERGFILREADLWRLWYTGYNPSRSSTKFLGYATSSDGVHWNRHADNPLFDGSWVEDMCVVKNDGIYYMFAEGLHDIAHLMTSTDGVHWQDHGNLDIRTTTSEPLSPGPYGTPTIWMEDSQWHLFYERGDRGIWLATSKDRRRLEERPR